MKAIRPARPPLLLELVFDAAVAGWGIVVVRHDVLELLFIAVYAPASAWVVSRRVRPEAWATRQPPLHLPGAEHRWRTVYYAATPALVFAIFVAVGEFTSHLATAVGAAIALSLLFETAYVLKTVLEYERKHRNENSRLWYVVYSYSPIRRVSWYYFPRAASGRE